MVPARPRERILLLGGEAGRGELVDKGTIHLRVDIEITIVEGPIRTAKPRACDARSSKRFGGGGVYPRRVRTPSRLSSSSRLAFAADAIRGHRPCPAVAIAARPARVQRDLVRVSFSAIGEIVTERELANQGVNGAG